ncbi:MAG: symE [Firmicutes bacterium]|nr:symE [Bacillota bacterium]
MPAKTRIKRILTVYYIYQNDKMVPLVRLRGKWLQELGFEPGDKIEVAAKKGVLLIRVISNDATADFC